MSLCSITQEDRWGRRNLLKGGILQVAQAPECQRVRSPDQVGGSQNPASAPLASCALQFDLLAALKVILCYRLKPICKKALLWTASQEQASWMSEPIKYAHPVYLGTDALNQSRCSTLKDFSGLLRLQCKQSHFLVVAQLGRCS